MDKKGLKEYITKENVCILLLILLIASCLYNVMSVQPYSEKKVDIDKNLSVLVENNSVVNELDNGKEFIHAEQTFDFKIFHVDSVDKFFSNLISNIEANENMYQVSDFNETHTLISLSVINYINYDLTETFSDGSDVYEIRVIVPNDSFDRDSKTIKEGTEGLVIMGDEQTYTDHIVDSLRGK